MSDVPVLTIDGPSGSGKGTVASALATRLGWQFLDSGALYRLVGLAALERDISLDEELKLAALAQSLDIVFQPERNGQEGVILDGQAVGDRIRNEAVARAASRVAALPAVRRALMALQHGFRRPPGLVADGRDMGTVVFPDAPCKVFLTASAEERARRRYEQLKKQGLDVTLPALLGEIRERDERDANRSVAPLRPAADAEVIDTTDLSIDEVINEVLRLVAERVP